MNYQDPALIPLFLQKLKAQHPQSAQLSLQEALTELLESPIPFEQHLLFLEQMRKSMDVVQKHFATTYASKALSPQDPNNTVLCQVVSLWQLMARSYAMLARSEAEEESNNKHSALLSQRQLVYLGLSLLEHYRAKRAAPAMIWLSLHHAYLQAEQCGVAKIRVADNFNVVWHAQSASEAYATLMLIDLANPYGRNRRELEWVYRWSQRFAPYFRIGAIQEDSFADLGPRAYGLNLNSDHGLRPLKSFDSKDLEPLRFFKCDRLRSQIEAVQAQFKRGATPASLGLGENAPVHACSQLLMSLYRPWGQGTAGRRYMRRPATGLAKLSNSWNTILTHVQQDGADDTNWADTSNENSASMHCHCTILDQSIGGFRLRMSQRPSNFILSHRQIIGVRPQFGKHCLLAQVSWLMFQEDGSLEFGVNLLGGASRPVTISTTEKTDAVNKHSAFLLAENPSTNRPVSLILPAGSYHPGKSFLVKTTLSPSPVELDFEQLRMSSLLRRGANFDQVAYEVVS